MSRVRSAEVFVLIYFPRVSGDEPASIKTHEAFLLFSPRERG